MLTNRVAIYVPSTLHHKKAPRSVIREAVQSCKVFLAKKFGGFTAYPAKGGWVSPETSKLVEEDVVIVVAFAAALSTQDIADVHAFARSVAVSMDQECVSVEVNGSLSFIDAKPEAVAA